MRFPTEFNPAKHGFEYLQEIEKNKNYYHPGIDFNNGDSPQADEGQDVVAICDGIVDHIGENCGSWGDHIILFHPKYDVYSHYAHLQDGSMCVKEGERVKEGQLIGLLGSTGGNWTAHLHFEIRLQKFHPHIYTRNMLIDKVKERYADPINWIEEKIEEEKKNNIVYIRLINYPESNDYFILGKDGKKYWIPNDPTFQLGKNIGLWEDYSAAEKTSEPIIKNYTLNLKLE